MDREAAIAHARRAIRALLAICSMCDSELKDYLLGVGGRGLFGGGPGHGGMLEGAGPLKLYPNELREVGSLGLRRVCDGAGIASVWKCKAEVGWFGWLQRAMCRGNWLNTGIDER